MTLESVGILIALRAFDERNAVAHVFSREYGVMTGMLRGAVTTRTNRPLVGQVGNVSWNARIESALGVFHWEPEKNLAAPIMTSADALGAMNAAFDLICTMVPARESYANLYKETIRLLGTLAHTTDPGATYLDWEIKLIGELGYAFDLSHCSGCGGTENLHYISPRTARAVCDDCAAPYISHLYRMPVGLSTTFAFLNKICAEMGATMPDSRRMMAAKKF